MTTDTQSPEGTAPEANAAPADPPKVQSFEDELQELQFRSLDKLIKEKNELVGRANAANGDVATLTEQIRENSEDPEIAEAREQMSKWMLKLDELVKPKVEEALANKGEDTNKLEENIKAVDAKLKPGVKYYKEMYGDDAYAFFTKQSRLVGVTVRSSGGRRIRGYQITVTLDGKDTTWENFSSAAKHIGVDTLDLQQAFMGKAGTEDAAKFPAVVSFSINYSETDTDGNVTENEAFIKAVKSDAQTEADADSNESANDSVEDGNAPVESVEADAPDEDDIANAL